MSPVESYTETTLPKEDRPVASNRAETLESQERGGCEEELACALKEPTETTNIQNKAEGLELNSITPLFDLLPAWKNINGHYVLSGEITKGDVKRVKELASKVTKFIHFVGPQSKDIPPDAYIRFLQHVPTPLFPSLDSVRLLFLSSQLHYIPLLFTPSLTHLEIGYVPNTAIHVVKSFLATIPFEAPSIEHLELRGPIQLSEDVLLPVFQLKQLRHVELDDILAVNSSSKVLRHLATLPLLEVLNIIERTPVPVSASSKSWDPAKDVTGFPRLQSLRITGSLHLIYEAVSLVSSRDLRTLRLSVITHPFDDPSIQDKSRIEELRMHREHIDQLKQRQKERVMTERLAAEKRARERESAIRIARGKVDAARVKLSGAKSELQTAERMLAQVQEERRMKLIEKRIKKLKNSGASPQMLQEARTKLEKEFSSGGNNKKIKAAKRQIESWKEEVTRCSLELSVLERAHDLLVSGYGADRVQAAEVVDSTEDIEAEVTPTAASAKDGGWQRTLSRIADLTCSCWQESLENFVLEVDEQSSSSIPIIELSSLLGVIVQGWPKIRHLRLPIGRTTGVSLNMIHSIAKHCPLLEYIKIQVDLTTLPELPDRSGATFGLLHGLKTLSVDCDTSVDDKQSRTRIARYLNLLFPHLETLSSPGSSETAGMWNDILEQIKLFQLIREDDRCRGLLK
ncbi:hypothetical protein BDQ17DRAFT_1543297 [Cyathus striatus]|nr:hypothetical protein BDQ17DRAFT_1543297 [Cyathus striatus]